VTEGLFETASDKEALERAAAAAAPTVVERVDLAMVHTLSEELRKPMFALLSSLADNKYLLGRRYAEWCTGAPMLESAVAAAAMAQDELGHARSFYPLLRGFSSSAAFSMEERGWQQRATSAMRCLDARFQTWADFIAVNLVVDTAMTMLLEAATDSPYEPLRQRARKIEQEESGHWVHASGWLRRLAPAALAQALNGVWDHAFTWFGTDDDPAIGALAASGVLAHAPKALRHRLRARLEPVLDETGLAEPLLARELPWPKWDASARRLTD
jgi:ring-1,2-phenylacetyl-CoA epoxidase subunit PaaC